MEELQSESISIRNCPEMLRVLLDYSSSIMSLFEHWRPVYVDMYVQAVLNVNDKPTKTLCEAFELLFDRLANEEFENIVYLSVRMLDRNPKLVLESIGFFFRCVECDLSEYGVKILQKVLSETWHVNEVRKLATLDIIRCSSQKSRDPGIIESMVNAVIPDIIIESMVNAVIPDIGSSGGRLASPNQRVGSSGGRLASPNQRVGMIYALQELSRFAEKTCLNAFSSTVCDFLMDRYAADVPGNEEVKLACLTALASWVARSTDAIGQKLFTFIDSGLKEKGSLRRGHLRCIRVIYTNADAGIFFGFFYPDSKHCL